MGIDRLLDSVAYISESGFVFCKKLSGRARYSEKVTRSEGVCDLGTHFTSILHTVNS